VEAIFLTGASLEAQHFNTFNPLPFTIDGAEEVTNNYK
jgi:hypothetical protein